MIFITSMCFNLMSDGFRSAMDVRLNRTLQAARNRPASACALHAPIRATAAARRSRC